MAERKSGPVKPPVIDLKARETTDASAETPEAPAAAEPAEAAAPKPKSSRGAKPVTEAAPPVAESKGEAELPFSGPETGRAAADGVPLPGDRSAEAAPEQATAPEPAPEPAFEPASEPQTPPAPEPEPQPAPIPRPPRPPARLAMPWSAISIAAGAGAVLGAGLTYLLANWIALPHQAPPFDDPAPALASLNDSVDGLETRLATAEGAVADTRASLETTASALATETAALRQSIADVEAAIPEPQPPVDLSSIEAELQRLDSRVAAIASGASSADAAALAEDLVRIEQSLAAIDTRLTEFENRASANDASLAALRDELETAKTAIAAQTRTLGGAEIGPAVKLPLIVSGLEAAFATGRPYASELDGLRALLPDLDVPSEIAARADSGLARPDALATRFEEALPDILAGRTGEMTGDWAQDALTWARALLALRPAEEMEGDTPEAIVSRLEAAVERRDFIAAAALLAQLPAPMRQAAGDVGSDIAAHAQAATFVTDLRNEALAPAAEPAN